MRQSVTFQIKVTLISHPTDQIHGKFCNSTCCLPLLMEIAWPMLHDYRLMPLWIDRNICPVPVSANWIFIDCFDLTFVQCLPVRTVNKFNACPNWQTFVQCSLVPTENSLAACLCWLNICPVPVCTGWTYVQCLSVLTDALFSAA